MFGDRQPDPQLFLRIVEFADEFEQRDCLPRTILAGLEELAADMDQKTPGLLPTGHPGSSRSIPPQVSVTLLVFLLLVLVPPCPQPARFAILEAS